MTIMQKSSMKTSKDSIGTTLKVFGKFEYCGSFEREEELGNC